MKLFWAPLLAAISFSSSIQASQSSWVFDKPDIPEGHSCRAITEHFEHGGGVVALVSLLKPGRTIVVFSVTVETATWSTPLASEVEGFVWVDDNNPAALIFRTTDVDGVTSFVSQQYDLELIDQLAAGSVLEIRLPPNGVGAMALRLPISVSLAGSGAAISLWKECTSS